MAGVVDVVVVGNGVIGLAVALTLARRDPATSIAVVGPRVRPGGASAAAGAMLGCFGEVTKFTLASEAGRAKFALARDAQRLWPAFLAEIEDACGEPAPSVRPGTHVIFNSRGGSLDSENFAAMTRALEEFGEDFEIVDEVPGLDPVPDSRPLRTLFLPGEGSVDARALLSALELACVRLGVRVVDDVCRSIATAGDRVRSVVLSSGEIECGHVVLAAGSFTSALLDGLVPAGSIPPVLSGSGVAFLTERVMGRGFSTVVRTVNRAGSCGLHVVPLGERREYYGATNVVFGTPETRAHLGVCHFVMESVIGQLDQAACYSRIDEVLIGNRPVALDTFPLLGRTSVQRLILITGTYRDGLHAAPALAGTTADMVLDDAPGFPAIFRPQRRPISTCSVTESIDEYVHQAVSSAYEGDTRLTHFLHSGDLEAVFRPRAERVYEELGTDAGLAPDIVTYLAQTRKDPSDVQTVKRYLAESAGAGR